MHAGLRRGYLGEMQVGGNRMFPPKFVALEFWINFCGGFGGERWD